MKTLCDNSASVQDLWAKFKGNFFKFFSFFNVSICLVNTIFTICFEEYIIKVTVVHLTMNL